MDWIAFQENYFFMVLTLCSLCIGGFVLGIMLGYVWIQLRQFGNALARKTRTVYSKMPAHVSARPRRQIATVVSRGFASAREHVSGQSNWQNAHWYASGNSI